MPMDTLYEDNQSEHATRRLYTYTVGIDIFKTPLAGEQRVKITWNYELEFS